MALSREVSALTMELTVKLSSNKFKKLAKHEHKTITQLLVCLSTPSISNVLIRIVDGSVPISPADSNLCCSIGERANSSGQIVEGTVEEDQKFVDATSLKLFHANDRHDLEFFEELSLVDFTVLVVVHIEHLVD